MRRHWNARSSRSRVRKLGIAIHRVNAKARPSEKCAEAVVEYEAHDEDKDEDDDDSLRLVHFVVCGRSQEIRSR